MASPQQFDDPSPTHHGDPAPRVLRLRLVPWDVVSLLALVTMLAALAFGTNWYTRLFGFLKDVCVGDCPPAPFGVDYYIYPIVWGGIGAAVAAALLGPLVVTAEGLVPVLLASTGDRAPAFRIGGRHGADRLQQHVLAQQPRCRRHP